MMDEVTRITRAPLYRRYHDRNPLPYPAPYPYCRIMLHLPELWAIGRLGRFHALWGKAASRFSAGY